MRIAEMIAAKRGSIATEMAARNAATVEIEALRDAEANEANTAKLAELRAKRDKADAALRSLQDSVTVLEAADAEERAIASSATIVVPTPVAGAAEARAHVVNEPSVYSPATADDVSFFSDSYRFRFKNDPSSRERLERHSNEVRSKGLQVERATNTTSFAGLVVPQYLVDQAALVARAGRPTANLMTKLPLPAQGMSLIIPRATTGVSAAVQAAENTAVSNTDEVMTNVTVPVVTIAGQQIISRQMLERGTPGIDALIYMDLAAAYAVALDQQVLYGTGSSGQMLGIYNTSGVFQSAAIGAPVTTALAYTRLAGGVNAVETLRYMAPDAIVMHPRRWNWLLTQFDTTGRPLVVPNQNGPMNAIGAGGDPAYGQVVGSIFGIPVTTDASVQTNLAASTNNDVIYVFRKEDGLLWENGDGMPRQLDFEQAQAGLGTTLASPLSTTLVAYNFAAFTAGRYPTAFALVGGNDTSTNGFIPPTF